MTKKCPHSYDGKSSTCLNCGQHPLTGSTNGESTTPLPGSYVVINDGGVGGVLIAKQPIEVVAIGGANNKDTTKETSSVERKNTPVFSGVMQYFPDALMEISRHSKKGNDKHNPGQPLHWAKEKSTDHADCIARHLIDIGPNWDALDHETQSLHAAALAWRALALLQTVLERKTIDK